MPEIPLAAAVLGSAIIGGGASIFGASKAADAQTNAANQASATQKAMFEEAMANSRELSSPFINMGKDAISPLQRLTTPGADQTAALEETPGYKFALSQGEKGVTNQATMGGLSGNTLRAGAGFATGLAQNTWSDVVNKLLAQVGMGATTAGSIANNNMSNATAVGGQLGANITGAGNAQAGADIAGANAVSGGVGNISNALMLNSMMGGKLFGKSGGGGAWGSSAPPVQTDPFNMPGS